MHQFVFAAFIKMSHCPQRSEGTRDEHGIRNGIGQAGIQERSKTTERVVKMIGPIHSAATAAESLAGATGRRTCRDGRSVIQSGVRRAESESQIEVPYPGI